jgi:gluconokinase
VGTDDRMTRASGPGEGPQIVVMGPSGAGKSVVGIRLAAVLAVPFVDADDLHPQANIDKMSAGIPLDDDDRLPWLSTVGLELARHRREGIVVACSALRRAYRDRIRAEAPATRFYELVVDPAQLEERLGARPGHFMPAALLASQLSTLEPLEDDELGARIVVREDPAALAETIAERIRRG